MLSTQKIKKSLILSGSHTPVGGENLNTMIKAHILHTSSYNMIYIIIDSMNKKAKIYLFVCPAEPGNNVQEMFAGLN